jgi:hypothetical protein
LSYLDSPCLTVVSIYQAYKCALICTYWHYRVLSKSQDPPPCNQKVYEPTIFLAQIFLHILHDKAPEVHNKKWSKNIANFDTTFETFSFIIVCIFNYIWNIWLKCINIKKRLGHIFPNAKSAHTARRTDTINKNVQRSQL